MKKRVVLIVCLILALTGAGVFAYPTASNWVAVRSATRDIRSYMQASENYTDEEKETMLQAAANYNAAVSGSRVADPYTSPKGAIELDDLLDYVHRLEVDGMVAYIEIPIIEVALPIRHGTEDEILDKCVGHVAATSLPTGGEGNHAVLTAHRSQPQAKLFADLNQMEVGDRFYIIVLGEIHCYEVYDTCVVVPDDTSLLQPEEGRDLTTLVTCEPYASEEYRLLVRGERVLPDPITETGLDLAPDPYSKEINGTITPGENTYTPMVSIAQTGDKGPYLWLAAGAAALAGLAVLLIVRRKKRK